MHRETHCHVMLDQISDIVTVFQENIRSLVAIDFVCPKRDVDLE